MADITWLNLLAVILAAVVGIHVVGVRNRFKAYEQNIRAAIARTGATTHYARSIDRHADRQSGKAQRHADQIANKGVRRGPRGQWKPAFFADFNPWADARGIEVVIPAMQAGLGGRDQEHQARLTLIEAIRIYNRDLDQIPGGTVAEYVWHFRHYSYRVIGTIRNRQASQKGGGRPPRRPRRRRRNGRGRP